MEKINKGDADYSPEDVAVWEDDKELILKLCGLK